MLLLLKTKDKSRRYYAIPSAKRLSVKSITDAELCNKCTVSFNILLVKIREKVSSVTNHLKKTAARMIILLVNLQMLCELVDSVCKNCNLNLGEPVSPSWVAYSCIIACFSACVIIIHLI
jgi:hypothetical protein